MHIARVGERLPRLQIQFRISCSFRPRNLANLGSKIRFWIRRKEHTLRVISKAISVGVAGKKFSKRQRHNVLLVLLFRLGALDFKIPNFYFSVALIFSSAIFPDF